MMSIELEDLVTEDDNNQLMTNGEAAILAKLSEIQEQLDELTEKVSNLNLTDNSGLSIDSY